ncbi:MAG: hypothetical protein IAA81_04585 [Spirochaetes bacterium]|uniref:Uncharacterized protein n=1 Tax=Candidatus Gallitreponema excrementavium TaxID=2840840 RepID=A0A9D9N227_9SPIR|nr:hypothetical protein [Candidatus Gallitreponema excrementavium]
MEKTKSQTQQIEDDVLDTGKIYCANCINCKLVPAPADSSGQFYLRVRCTAGKWKKKLGEEKLYKYCTVSRRSIDYCDSYEDMGESQEFMRELRRSLPVKDELYS